MKIQRLITALIIVASLLLGNFSQVHALPPLPSSFNGTVRVDGLNVPDGTSVRAWVNGVQYASTTTVTYLGSSVYALDVPGDDPATTPALEGGIQGDTVVFHIGSLTATSTGSWATGTNVTVNLVALAEHSLTITSAHGTVAKSPDQLTYHNGDLVTLTATPSVGYVFSGWTGGLVSATNPDTVTINGDTSVTANYATAQFQLTVNRTGSGSGTVTSTPAGIDCGLTCSFTYDYNTPVTLAAAPGIGSTFFGWSGAGCSGTDTCQVTMTAAATVEARFADLWQTWYLAEGYTGASFGTYILIQNPNLSEANIRVTYMLQGGGTVVRYITVGGNSRYTIVAQDAGQVGVDKAFSTKLDSDQQIIVERAMYWPNGSGTWAGHVTTGIQQAATTWYLAEGFTGAGFGTFILIQNPNGTATDVNVTYMLDDGSLVDKVISVPANSRETIVAHDPGQVGPNKAFATKLVADLPIVVERAMYFNNEGHATGGVTLPNSTWYLAEGFTGAGFGTYILIQNPNAQPASVDVTYMLQGGAPVTKNVVVAGNSRYTIVAQEAGQVGVDKAFSTLLVANRPIIVERAMYWPNGEGTIGGHDTAGVNQADTTWYLAEGYTGDNFSTFILLQNPNLNSTDVDVTYMIQGAGMINKTVTVAGKSRYTIEVHSAGQLGSGVAFSTKLVSVLPIIVERAMYFPNGGHAAVGVVIPH